MVYLFPFFLLLFPLNYHNVGHNKHINTMAFLYHGPLTFVCKAPLLPPSLQNPLTMVVDDVVLKMGFLETSHSIIWLVLRATHI